MLALFFVPIFSLDWPDLRKKKLLEEPHRSHHQPFIEAGFTPVQLLDPETDLCRGFVRSGLRGAKLLEEPIAVFSYERFYAVGGVRADDQTRMMVAVEMLDDLGRVVAAGVGLFLAGETDDASGIEMLHLWKSVLHVEER